MHVFIPTHKISPVIIGWQKYAHAHVTSKCPIKTPGAFSLLQGCDVHGAHRAGSSSVGRAPVEFHLFSLFVPKIYTILKKIKGTF